MNSPFIELISGLEQNLANKKLGEYAHKLMAPQGRLLAPDHDIPPRLSAILIVFYEKDNQIFFPIIRRNIYNGLHSGQMGFPGGKFELNDKTLINTALRESQEEIGINSKEVVVLGTLSELYIPITNMQILPVLGYLKTEPDFILNSHEVDSIFAINLADINDSNKVTELWTIREAEVNVPFYYIHEQKIWGATAMILSELEQLLLAINFKPLLT
jgi:8-oxo-dGTP pyrophosphatase MutT (NUDIX family)